MIVQINPGNRLVKSKQVERQLDALVRNILAKHDEAVREKLHPEQIRTASTVSNDTERRSVHKTYEVAFCALDAGKEGENGGFIVIRAGEELDFQGLCGEVGMMVEEYPGVIRGIGHQDGRSVEL
ncbi:uncharacterized protein LTR77_004093 [Saxophila tyrrhenica]|uniref:Uncharacterized protein n=1 Tax=Saxophila tyrrhenica TaxID=1690608 RepID=A0AAV9PEB6_9PEZI|nr:hypothetical protein LTR77_004093 [Saxophila tyrrhenica]